MGGQVGDGGEGAIRAGFAHGGRVKETGLNGVGSWLAFEAVQGVVRAGFGSPVQLPVSVGVQGSGQYLEYSTIG